MRHGGHALDSHEKRKSFSTGEPENSGFNRMQLGYGVSRS